MRMILLVVTTFSITLLQRGYGSTLSLEWPCRATSTNADYDSYLIEYNPPIGYPPTNSKFPLNRCTALISDTISATIYNVSISVILSNGSMLLISRKKVRSSPDAPTFTTITTAQSDTVFSFLPPHGNDLSYQIEYYPTVDRQQQLIIFETEATHIALTDLKPSTEYTLKITTKYRGIESDQPAITTFKTKGKSDNTNAYIDSSSGYNNQSPPHASGIFPPAATAIENALAIPEHELDYTNKSSIMLPTASEVTVKTEWGLKPQGNIERPDAKLVRPEVTQEAGVDSVKSSLIEHSTSEQLRIKTSWKGNSKSQLTSFTKPNDAIRLSRMHDGLKVEWDQPEGISCEAYLLNCTVTDPQRSQSFAVGATTTQAIVKIPTDQRRVELQIFCVVDGSVINGWWAYRIVDFRNPNCVKNLRVVDAFTDDYCVSQVELEWDWPSGHNFHNHRIVVSYTTEESSDENNEIEVKKMRPVTITQLKPSERYIFIVKNISREFGIASEAVEVYCTTPPAITSILYPHQVSSTSINIDFDGSNEKYKFDRYLLIFTDDSTNVTQDIGKHERKSFNFTNLTPGQTYKFALHTLYGGIRSRAVTTNVTTYPLKVEKLYAVVGTDYVVLHWDVQKYLQNNCRFRLSYTDISNIGQHNSSTVETISRKKFRFGQLASDTYYTFTVIVIMGIAQQETESEAETITVAIGGARRSFPVLQRRDSRELIVTFENDQNIFSNVNGAVDNYAVIVSQDAELEDDDDYELRSWYDIRAERRWPPYRASPLDYNPFRGSNVKSAKFIIGEEDCEQKQPDEKYCNGVLRANVNFFVKIRAYTVTNVAMETNWVSIDDGDDGDQDHPSDAKRLPCHLYLNSCPRKSADGQRPSLRAMLSAILFSLPLYNTV